MCLHTHIHNTSPHAFNSPQACVRVYFLDNTHTTVPAKAVSSCLEMPCIRKHLNLSGLPPTQGTTALDICQLIARKKKVDIKRTPHVLCVQDSNTNRA